MSPRQAPDLNVSRDLRLPLDAVTETFWWSGTRGSGKTHDASVFVEELLAHKQVVVIDPMRAWWGLRSSMDGKSAGFGIPIFGGPRGDVPLESSAGAYLADLAMAERVSMILDVKEWSAPLDRKAIQAWFEVHDPDRVAEAMARLPFLPTGTAIVSSTEFLLQPGDAPVELLGVVGPGPLDRLRHRLLDGGHVDVGQGAGVAAGLADLGGGRGVEGPAGTEGHLAEGLQDLAAERKARPAPEPVIERVEVPVLDEGLVLRLEQALSPLSELLDEIRDRLTGSCSG